MRSGLIAPAFDRFLDAFVMDEFAKLPALKDGQRERILLEQGFAQIPGYGHIDIVFIALERADQAERLRPEALVQKIPHQANDREALGVWVAVSHPKL